MYKKLTLRNRIFLITSCLILLAYALVLLFVRPKYREAIINERTTIVSQLQEYSLRRTDETIRNWLNATSILAESISSNPSDTEGIIRGAINYTPGLVRITLSEDGSDEMLDFTRTIYQGLDFPASVDEWYESKLDQRVNVAWLPDTTDVIDIFIAQRIIQIDLASGDQLLFTLNMFFDAKRLTFELIDIPLGDGRYRANIVSDLGEHIVVDDFTFPSELFGDASFSEEKEISFNNNTWFVMSSRFETIPFWHLIAVDDDFILEPVNRLILFSLLAGIGILVLMVSISWYVSNRMNRPISQILEDVDHISNLEFDHSIRKVDLPEFGVMQETLENIRITLNRYQKINVEKIILEEWKNRYMMTYSEDFIGILDNDGKFRFANNHFVQFIESFGFNPKEVTFDELLNTSKLELSKSNQAVHYPNPYTIKINQAELAHFMDEETTYFYDYQHVAFEDEQNNSQGALVVLHDKTKDRLLDIKRTDMINIIVHELKNPITGVVGLSKIMIDNPEMSQEDNKELLKEIYLSGERMNDLVNRFLDVQRLEHGRIPVEFSPVDLFQLVNDVKSISNPLLSQKKLKINISAKGTSFIVSGSKDLLFDAVQNLVSNAIKYGDSDRIIDLELVNNPDQTELSVTDHGYGISIEDQQKVFDKFFRVRSNIKSAKEKGTGLGLAYVKEIMHRHNGDVQLESNEEIGSRFTLIFPNNETE
jgi:signal transduction histidine kinase